MAVDRHRLAFGRLVVSLLSSWPAFQVALAVTLSPSLAQVLNWSHQPPKHWDIWATYCQMWVEVEIILDDVLCSAMWCRCDSFLCFFSVSIGDTEILCWRIWLFMLLVKCSFTRQHLPHLASSSQAILFCGNRGNQPNISQALTRECFCAVLIGSWFLC